MRFRPGLIVVFGLLLAASSCASSGTSSSPTAASPSSAATPSPSGPAATPSPSSTASTAPAPPPSAGSGGTSELTVVVDDGTGSTTTWRLTCDPIGGDHPDAAQACAAVADHLSALNPVPKDRMCAQVYGGPEKATVTGTWAGEQVFAALNRTNACETARWDALVPLVPAGGR